MRRKSSGYGLLEVLAALVIVNVAALGFLQTRQSSEQHHQNILAQATAVAALDDMTARVIISPSNNAVGLTSYGEPPPHAPSCRWHACSTRAWASASLARWKCRFETWFKHAACAAFTNNAITSGLIPNGDGRVRRVGNHFEIAVRWQSGGQEYAMARNVTRFEPPE